MDEAVILDVEGNGRAPPELIAVATASVLNWRELGEISAWRVKPRERVTWAAKRIHGIGNRDLVDAPLITEVAPQVHDRLAGRIVVGHHVSPDITNLELSS